jgi:hypothetical protein
MASDATALPHLSTGKNLGGSVAPVPTALKRKFEGHGTASGQYRPPYPSPVIWHEKFATPTNSHQGATVNFEVELPNNVCGRWVGRFLSTSPFPL